MSTLGLQGVEDLSSADLWRLAEKFSVQLRRMNALGIRGRRQIGQRQSGADFDTYQPYRLGDDVRHVDWSVYARTERLHVRRFRDDQTGVLVVLLDASGSMGLGHPRKWTFAQAVGAVTALAALRELHQVVVGVMVDGGVRTLPVLHGMESAAAVIDFLSTVTPAGPTDLESAVEHVTRGLQSADLLIVSDFLDPSGGDAGLKAASNQGGGLHLARICALDEFKLSEEQMIYRDPESSSNKTKIATEATREVFDGAVQEHRRVLVETARGLGANIMDFSSHESLPRALETIFSHFTSRVSRPT